MKISLIAAMSDNRLIGRDNTLPWRLPLDLAWFKRHTVHKPIIMGRKTYGSIGHPLPKRHNIVLSQQPRADQTVTWVASLTEAFAAIEPETEEVMIIGGQTLYQQLLPQADRLYLTLIEANIEGNIYFPDYTTFPWHQRFSQYHLADANNDYPCRFVILERDRGDSSACVKCA